MCSELPHASHDFFGGHASHVTDQCLKDACLGSSAYLTFADPICKGNVGVPGHPMREGWQIFVILTNWFFIVRLPLCLIGALLHCTCASDACWPFLFCILHVCIWVLDTCFRESWVTCKAANIPCQQMQHTWDTMGTIHTCKAQCMALFKG